MQLIVLGMHRSGTSILARLLNMMGAYFGPEGMSTGANQENPKGFWERRDVRNLNDMILYSVNCDWDRVSNFDLKILPEKAIEEFNNRASKIVLEMDANRPWFLKEPRLCLLFPIWQSFFEVPICIHIYRSPIEVAKSLNKRNGISIDAGIALWEKYNLVAVEASKELPRILVPHRKLIQEPVALVDDLYSQLCSHGVEGLRKPSSKEITSFVDERLYRERSIKGDLEQYLNVKQKDFFETFEDGRILTSKKKVIFSNGGILALEEYELSFQKQQEKKTAQEAASKVASELKKQLDQKENELTQQLKQREQEKKIAQEAASKVASELKKQLDQKENELTQQLEQKEQEKKATQESSQSLEVELRNQLEQKENDLTKQLVQKAREEKIAQENASKVASELKRQLEQKENERAQQLEQKEQEKKTAQEASQKLEVELRRQLEQKENHLTKQLEQKVREEKVAKGASKKLEAKARAYQALFNKKGNEVNKMQHSLSLKEQEIKVMQDTIGRFEIECKNNEKELADEIKKGIRIQEQLIQDKNEKNNAIEKASKLEAALEIHKVNLDNHKKEIHNLTEQLSRNEHKSMIDQENISNIASSLRSTQTRYDEKTKHEAQIKKQLTEISREKIDFNLKIEGLKKKVKEKELLQKQLGDTLQNIAGLHKEIKHLESENKAVEDNLGNVLTSYSWKITQPCRFILDTITSTISCIRKGTFNSRCLAKWVVRYKPAKSVGMIRSYLAIKKSGLFDAEYYLNKSPDILENRINPLMHYIEFGANEGRDPSPEFSTNTYTTNNSDAGESGLNPLLHYLIHGKSEDRGAWQRSVLNDSDYPTKNIKKKIVIYTAISGGYENLKIPEHVSENCEYVCFTDKVLDTGGVWKLRGFDYFNADHTRTARFVKTHPHLYFVEYDWSIWVDGNLLIRGDLEEFIDKIKDTHKIGMFIHPHRQCIFEEAKEINKRGGLDHPSIVNDHVKKYQNEGFKKNIGLSETNVVVRQHNNPDIISLMGDWWKEIDNGSKRDQLSINYVALKNNIKIAPLAQSGISVRNDSRFTRHLHDKKENEMELQAKRKEVEQFLPTYFEKRSIQPQSLNFSHVSVDIVVCIHNALEDVKRCLDSVTASLRASDRIILIDDGSQPDTKTWVQNFTKRTPGSILVRHDIAKGYTKAANAGMRIARGDYVILLNSDTIVPQNWLHKLLQIGESNKDVGIIGPLSNAASWQSVPDTLDKNGDLAVNDLPEGLDVSKTDQVIEKISSNTNPRVPLLNGFCMVIKREVITRVGFLDETSFPDGYGEENDYCLRVTDAGYSLVVASNTYVFHGKSKSYSHERRRILSKKGSIAFRSKYAKSRVDNAIITIKTNPLLSDMREKFKSYINNLPNGVNQEKKTAALPSKNIRPEVSSPQWKIDRYVSIYDLSYTDSKQNLKVNQEFLKNPSAKTRHVLWFIPNFDHIYRGGIYTIFATANHFSQEWGTVNTIVIYSGSKEVSLAPIKDQISKAFPSLKFNIIQIKDGDDISVLPVSDCAFCTLWTTAYFLARYNRCQAKFYFIQDFEPAFYAAGSSYALIEQTYHFGFFGICNTAGVAEAYRRYNPWVDYFTPAVNKEIYYPRKQTSKKNKPYRIVFYGRPNNPRNGFRLGIESLKKVKQHFGDEVQIISVGSEFSEKAYGLTNIVENWGVLPSHKEVADLYRTSDLGLVFMFTAHPSYQPLEFMACGCITITNNNLSNNWILKNRENTILSETTVSCVSHHIITTLQDKMLREKIIHGGYETIQSLSWDDAFSKICSFVSKPVISERNFIDDFKSKNGNQ